MEGNNKRLEWGEMAKPISAGEKKERAMGATNYATQKVDCANSKKWPLGLSKKETDPLRRRKVTPGAEEREETGRERRGRDRAHEEKRRRTSEAPKENSDERTQQIL